MKRGIKMNFFDGYKLPSSMSYSELIFKMEEDRVAYCYSGRVYKDAVMLKINGKLVILRNGELIQDNEKIDSFELWAFIDEIEDGFIRQKAVNKFFEIYLNYNGHLKLEDIEYRL